MKFKNNDRVRVVSGFYKGETGRIIGWGKETFPFYLRLFRKARYAYNVLADPKSDDGDEVEIIPVTMEVWEEEIVPIAKKLKTVKK